MLLSALALLAGGPQVRRALDSAGLGGLVAPGGVSFDCQAEATLWRSSWSLEKRLGRSGNRWTSLEIWGVKLGMGWKRSLKVAEHGGVHLVLRLRTGAERCVPRKKWCCQKVGRGCSAGGQGFDCRAGYNYWQEL